MPDSIPQSSIPEPATSRPDYIKLVKYLVEPFLEYPESLSVDCEQLNQDRKIWLRLAFAGKEKGRVFGRGGRNIKAISTILQTAAAAANQNLYLDIYEDSEQKERKRTSGSNSQPQRRKSRTRRSAVEKPSLKSRS
ncbi:MAG: KH domain-containing protein [Prochloraceae cyanobacterium]|nr:KH domain-containing protein [Prochloraceae cyanobacterium]